MLTQVSRPEEAENLEDLVLHRRKKYSEESCLLPTKPRETKGVLRSNC